MGNIIVILTLFHEEQGQDGTVLHLYSLKNSLKDGRTSENKCAGK